MTWKASDVLTLVSEANLVRDGFGTDDKSVNGFGFAQYASYALTDTVALNGRAEYWRDDNNFFVASFPTTTLPSWRNRALPRLSILPRAPAQHMVP